MKLEFHEVSLADTQKRLKPSGEEGFFLFYSTYFGGYTRDRLLMTVPIDDHLVHRGDGVFDNSLCIDGNYYLLDRHIDRFFFSAGAIGIKPSFSRDELKQLLVELGVESKQKNFIARFFLSRGAGSMSVYPHEATAPNLYVLIGKSSPPPERYFREGMVAATSPVGMRPPTSPQVKSVDYLANALMELSAKSSGADAAIAVDPAGNITEGSNKNVVIVGKDGVLRVPPFEKILRGTTLTRALEMAEDLKKKKIIKGVSVENIPVAEAYNASEMIFFSTSFFAAPIVKYDGRIINDGKPGNVWRSFNELFKQDVKTNKNFLTPVR